jgi:hypothetical protein
MGLRFAISLRLPPAATAGEYYKPCRALSTLDHGSDDSYQHAETVQVKRA